MEEAADAEPQLGPIFPLDSYCNGLLTFLYPGHLCEFTSSTQGEEAPFLWRHLLFIVYPCPWTPSR